MPIYVFYFSLLSPHHDWSHPKREKEKKSILYQSLPGSPSKSFYLKIIFGTSRVVLCHTIYNEKKKNTGCLDWERTLRWSDNKKIDLHYSLPLVFSRLKLFFIICCFHRDFSFKSETILIGCFYPAHKILPFHLQCTYLHVTLWKLGQIKTFLNQELFQVLLVFLAWCVFHRLLILR